MKLDDIETRLRAQLQHGFNRLIDHQPDGAHPGGQAAPEFAGERRIDVPRAFGIEDESHRVDPQRHSGIDVFRPDQTTEFDSRSQASQSANGEPPQVGIPNPSSYWTPSR